MHLQNCRSSFHQDRTCSSFSDSICSGTRVDETKWRDDDDDDHEDGDEENGEYERDHVESKVKEEIISEKSSKKTPKKT